MNITIVGIKESRFKNKETGEEISGQVVYFEHDDNRVRGVATDHVFIMGDRRLIPSPSLPVNADLYYNKYGKVDEIIVR